MTKSKSFSFITNLLKLKGIDYVIDDDSIIRAHGAKQALSVLQRIGLVTSTNSSDYYIGVKPPIYISMVVDSGKFGEELSIYDYSGIVNEIKDLLIAQNIDFTEKHEDVRIIFLLKNPQTMTRLDEYMRSCEGITAVRKFSNGSSKFRYTHTSCAIIYVAPHSIIIQ